jgi:hypothetical protein
MANAGQKFGYDELDIIKENKKFIMLPVSLAGFMGVTKAVFLLGIIRLYRYLEEKNKAQKGELYYSATKFEMQLSISPHIQNQVIKELATYGLLKEIGRSSRNCKRLKIYFNRYYCLLQLADNLYGSKLWSRYSFKKLQKNEKRRKVMLNFFNKMKTDWNKLRCGEPLLLEQMVVNNFDLALKEASSKNKNHPAKTSKKPIFSS